MMQARLLFVHALSPLHAGTGQGVDVIDLPIAREKATGLPYLPGSSVKGTLRDAESNERTKLLLFGPDTTNASDYAGSAQFGDQRLVLLPVRSLAGTFAWVSSPYVLRRFARDARDAGLANIPSVPAVHQYGCQLAEQSRLALTADTVVLEDLDLKIAGQEASAWASWLGNQLFPGDNDDQPAWRASLTERLCIVSDDVLTYLLTTATEVIARVRLEDDSKTVAQGALWYEEALPAETILAGPLVATPTKSAVYGKLSNAEIFDAVSTLIAGALQFGGKATVGRGICRVTMAK